MKDDVELVRGSGNVFRDFAVPHADLEQAKAILAAKIIATMDARGLDARSAAVRPHRPVEAPPIA